MNETTKDNCLIIYANQENTVKEKINRLKKEINEYETKSNVFSTANKYWRNIRVYGICIVCSVLLARYNIIDVAFNIKHFLVLLGSGLGISAVGQLVANYYTYRKLGVYLDELDFDISINSQRYDDNQELLLKEQDKLEKIEEDKDKFMNTYYKENKDHSNNVVEHDNSVVSSENNNIARRVLKPNKKKDNN